jgi:hypothetical protein
VITLSAKLLFRLDPKTDVLEMLLFPVVSHCAFIPKEKSESRRNIHPLKRALSDLLKLGFWKLEFGSRKLESILYGAYILVCGINVIQMKVLFGSIVYYLKKNLCHIHITKKMRELNKEYFRRLFLAMLFAGTHS